MAVLSLAVKCHQPVPPTDSDQRQMPTLTRLIIVLATIAVVGYAAMWALANFLEPQPRTITITVPQERFGK
jgi:hypothetical protein